MATLKFDNPFHDLWLTEGLDPSTFVQMFSDVLVQDAEDLFSSGNVVLKGRQGSGKSMLLNLLETGTRLAYAKTGKKYPVLPRNCRFVSAGVHLTQQNASLVAARASEYPEDRRMQTVASNFADYLNTLLCKDLLKNIELLWNEQLENSYLIKEVPIDLSQESQKVLFDDLRKSESWSEIIPKNCSINDLLKILDGRLKSHRLYGNGSLENLPLEITSTKALAGVPVAELAASLRIAGVFPSETLVLLRVDQHEELFELERHSKLGSVFRQVLNSALARRDPRIYYRIGTRHYAWEVDLATWGSGAPIEEARDYSVIDLDYILRRGEHSKGWKFPSLAKDVLTKRLAFAGFDIVAEPMMQMFGRSMDAQEKARAYAGDAPNVVKFEDDWAPEWGQLIDELWENGSPLDAKFAEAWLRQDRQTKKKIHLDGALATGLPWRRSEWWAKERNEIALLQIAGDRQQALIWSGEKQVVDLAGNNILAFMTICKTIWSTWQRRNPSEAAGLVNLPTFAIDDQIVGIIEASQIWFKKIQVGFESDRRSRFISAIGSWFRRRMLKDRRLAYPGHNGFSLLEAELQMSLNLVALIKICRDHGDLIESPHTTRNKSQERRVKWYLHPLLCPFFRIPHVRTKEPIYTNLSEIEQIYTRQIKIGAQSDSKDEVAVIYQLELPGFE